MALTIKDRVKGGDGCHSSLDKFDPKEVAMGLRVELEHTDDPEVALDIVRDHLSSYPKYYTRLKKAGLADELEEGLRRERQQPDGPLSPSPAKRKGTGQPPDLATVLKGLDPARINPDREKKENNITKIRQRRLDIAQRKVLSTALLEFINNAKP